MQSLKSFVTGLHRQGLCISRRRWLDDYGILGAKPRARFHGPSLGEVQAPDGGVRGTLGHATPDDPRLARYRARITLRTDGYACTISFTI